MDILYISQQAKKDLEQYCNQELIDFVIDHFGKNDKIIEKKDNEKPSRWWVITDYISDNTIDSRKKLSVILSFGAIGGILQIDNRQCFGDVCVLNMLKELELISDEDFTYFVDAFFKFSKGDGEKFL